MGRHHSASGGRPRSRATGAKYTSFSRGPLDLRVRVNAPKRLVLDMTKGRMIAHLPPRSPPRAGRKASPRVIVHTPHAEVRIIGTVFLINISQGETTVAVQRGKVEVIPKATSPEARASRAVYHVTAGKSMTALSGQRPVISNSVRPDFAKDFKEHLSHFEVATTPRQSTPISAQTIQIAGGKPEKTESPQKRRQDGSLIDPGAPPLR